MAKRLRLKAKESGIAFARCGHHISFSCPPNVNDPAAIVAAEVYISTAFSALYAGAARPSFSFRDLGFGIARTRPVFIGGLLFALPVLAPQ